MILDNHEKVIKHSRSPISIHIPNHEPGEWNRYLCIEGKKAFNIGDTCGTCRFLFERMEGANQSVSPEVFIDELNAGLKEISKPILEGISQIIPDGRYKVLLTKFIPELVIPGNYNDYFVNEQIELWGIDAFWGLPHNTKSEYYRTDTKLIKYKSGLFEFFVPMFPQNWLDQCRIEEYRKALRKGQKPTAVAISFFDVKQPAMWEGEKKINEHWCLAHYLIDGHHKLSAAATEGRATTLLSFLSCSGGCSTNEQLSQLIDFLSSVTE